MKKIFPFVLVFLSLTALLHFFILFVLTKSWSEPHIFNAVLNSVYIVGFTSILLMVISSIFLQKNRANLISWAGYSWIGIFFISLSYSFFYFVYILIGGPEIQIYVLISLILGTSLISFISGFRFPRIHLHRIKGPACTRGFRAIQISDLHVGMLYLNKSWLSKIVEKINFENPNAVFITGDLIEGHFSDLKNTLSVLNDIHCPHKF